MIDTIYKKVI